MKLSTKVLMSCLGFLPMQFAVSATIDECLQEQLAVLADTVTIGELKAICEQQQILSGDAQLEEQSPAMQSLVTEDEPALAESALARRLSLEDANNNPFTLLPHKPNYLIISNNMSSPHDAPFQEAFPNRNIHFQPWETKFQLSFKVPIVRGIYNGRGDLYMAYTNRSFWQQFNKAGSAPFRDSNHEPEAWLSFRNDANVLGFHNSVIRTGIVHQSNGQAGTLSRSWNRVYADFIFERGNWFFSLKPWYRLPEKQSQDDNPDIEDYLGNFELSGLYKYESQTFDFMVRDNLQSENNRGALQLNWSFPLSKNVRGYVQWFNGYGESLIDYNASSNSLGFGIQLTDWL